jgi:2,3-bisphosphoglycerate-dependent phosphoglycerate mutase
MQGTRLLVARHAETADPERFHGAESDIGLSAWGTRQAGLLAESLKDMRVSAVYSSAMRRAVDTAAPIGHAAGLSPVTITALHERRLGPMSGTSRADGWSIYAASKERWILGDIEHTHLGGESYADVRRRVVPVFWELAIRHRGQTIVVVAHGVVIRVLLTSVLAGSGPAEFDRIAIEFASVNDIWFDGTTWTAQKLNDVIMPSSARPVA